MAYQDEDVPPPTCKHMPDNAQTRNIIARALKQAERIESRCSACGKKGTLWCCLECQHLGCGRRMGGHALAHAKDSKHCISLNMNRGGPHEPINLYCYACQEDLMFFDDDEDDGNTGNENENESTNENDDENGNENENHSQQSTDESQTDSSENTGNGNSHHNDRNRQRNGHNSNHKPNGNSHRRRQQQHRPGQRGGTGNRSGSASHDMSNRSNHQSSSSDIQRGARRGIPPTEFPPPSKWKSAEEILTSQPIWIEYSYGGGTCGLANLGNTCFLNASLQALLHCPPIIYMLTTPEILHVGRFDRIKLIEHVVEITMAMWRGGRRYLVPKNLIRSMMHIFPQFRGYGQQDAHEFLRCLLDYIHEHFSYSISTYEKKGDEQKEKDANANGNGKKSDDKGDKQQSPEDVEMNGRTKGATNGKDDKTNDKTDASGDIEMADTQGGTQGDTNTGTPDGEGNDEKSKSDERENKSDKDSPAKRRWPKLTNLETTSIMQDVFGGQVVSEVECCECGNRSTTKEVIYDLSVEIPKPEQIDKAVKERDARPLPQRGWISSMLGFVGLSNQSIPLDLCMHSYCTSEDLMETNSYQCDKCNKKVDAKKSLHLSKLPEVLMIQIKRFSHSQFWNSGSKVSTHVDFPISNLNMKQYIHRDYQEKAENQETIYDLYSIVKHSGGTGGGHYVSFAKHPATGIWYYFDDIHCTKVTPEKVREQQAYILFYCRRRQQSHNIQSIQKILRMGNRKEQTIEISRYWFHRMVAYSRTSPVDNLWLSCYHGHPLPSNHDRRKICSIKISRAAWDELVKRFGTAYNCSMLELEQSNDGTKESKTDKNDESDTNGKIDKTDKNSSNEKETPGNASDDENKKKIDPNAFRAKGQPSLFEREPWEDSINSKNCIDCERDNVDRRRLYEKREITRLEKDGRPQDCVISIDWAQKWRAFVHGRSDIIPGCLDNRSLDNEDGMAKAGLQSNKDFLLVPTPIWLFLVDLYGGGPRLAVPMRSMEATPEIETASEDDTETETENSDVEYNPRPNRRNGGPTRGPPTRQAPRPQEYARNPQQQRRMQPRKQRQHPQYQQQPRQSRQQQRQHTHTNGTRAPQRQDPRQDRQHRQEQHDRSRNQQRQNQHQNGTVKPKPNRQSQLETHTKRPTRLPSPVQGNGRSGSQARSRSRERNRKKKHGKNGTMPSRSKSPLPSPVQVTKNMNFEDSPMHGNHTSHSNHQSPQGPLPPPNRKTMAKQGQ